MGAQDSAGLAPSPNLKNTNFAPTVLSIFWVECSIVVAVLVGRFHARRLLRAVSFDDWFMFFSGLLLLGSSGIVSWTAHLDGFRHLVFVPLQNLEQVAMNVYIFQTITTFAFGTSKFSIGYLILRLLPPNSVKLKTFIWVFIVLTCIFNWVQAILMWFQCSPTQALWNRMIPAKCWSVQTKVNNIYAGYAFNIVTDLILALLPALFIWNLKMDLRRRLRLLILLGLGSLAAVCGIIKMFYVHLVESPSDATYATFVLTILNGTELFVIIVCGSVPTLQIFFERFARSRKVVRSTVNYQSYATPGERYLELEDNKRIRATTRIEIRDEDISQSLRKDDSLESAMASVKFSA